MIDLEFAARIAGAAVVFVLGIWIGLGTPGRRRSRGAHGWRSGDRLRATWLNRAFFNMGSAPRRFDAGRLVAPKGESKKQTVEDEEDSKQEVVRFRR